MSLLYIVSVPIGHPGDITLWAVETLKKVDFVVCEELSRGQKLLKQLGIKTNPLLLNEHNEQEGTENIIQLLLQGQQGALFSDAGTPLFADPGTLLVRRCHEMGIRVSPVPGASSLLAALSVAGVDTRRFFYAGFLPRQSVERRRQISQLVSMPYPVVIYDTPYRLRALLSDISAEYPTDRTAVLALSLTQSDEQVFRGTIADLVSTAARFNRKREFVLILDPPTAASEVVPFQKRHQDR